MEVTCVRVPREEGERTRQELAEIGLIDRRFRIKAVEDWIYVPVSAPERVPADFEVVTCDVERRTTDTLPRDLLDEPPSYERLGDIALIDEDDPEYARTVADALMESSLPIKTVLNSRSKIQGEERVRDWELLAGEETETIHREFGAEFALDVTDVYFSPRLATERHRVVSQVEPGEHIFDMFAGVGPFLIPAVKQGGAGVGVDINERSIEYLEANAARNNVADRITAIHGDVRDVASEYRDWANRIIMNLPHSANEFLDTARILAGDRCILHYYDIQPEAEPFSPGINAMRRAFEPAYEIDIRAEHVVRSYAPHEVNVCLDVELERK